MSSFAGVSFRVVPSGTFFPSMEEDDTGVTRYSCDVVFMNRADRNAMASKVTLATEKVSLGTKSVTVRINAGYGAASLIVPSYGGTTITKQAILRAMTNSEAYGVSKIAQFKANLQFLVIGASSV